MATAINFLVQTHPGQPADLQELCMHMGKYDLPFSLFYNLLLNL